jgi:hypothetical protein
LGHGRECAPSEWSACFLSRTTLTSCCRASSRV